MVCNEAEAISAGTVLGGLLLVGTIFFLMTKYKEKQKEHLKNLFAERLVIAFDIQCSGQALSREALSKEFMAIDSGRTEGGNGLISKMVSSLTICCCAFS